MHRLKFWLTNRVVIGLIVFFTLIGLWEFRWKPQYRGFYEQGVVYYQGGQYQEALTEFNTAYNIAPNAVDVLMMQGWVNLKLKRYEEARMFFDRVLRIDPRVEEARMGAGFVALDTGRGDIDFTVLAKYLGKRSADPNVAILIAGSLVKEGKNREAAEIYLRLLNNRDYGKAAHEALSAMLGTTIEDEKPSVAFADTPRPAQLQTNYRAADGAMWTKAGNGWQKYYVAGMNLGPGAPGYYPGSPPTEPHYYADWIENAERMNANTLRVYTLLPPSFYRAFKAHTRSGGKVRLYQQVWVGDPPNKDLYDPKFVDDTKAEIRYVVDAIHGQGDIPLKYARGTGLYIDDVSADVSAILLGRELEASTAIQTNIINGGKQKYDGRYFSIAAATATEVWFAEMLDYLVDYETEKYNWQHPVAIVNWPPMDPLYHKTETPNLDEVKYRIRHGERLELPKNIDDDNDVVSIDEAKYKVKSGLAAGMFASYHVYPYYPDFLILDRDYLQARDSQGLNPVFAYVRDLRAHIPYPLVITEFGIPNSMGISHFHPYGWHHGGHTEEEQAAIVAQLSRGIKEAGSAGGIAFALIDEWYKHNWLTVDFQNPEERGAVWINELDPEKRYGVIGFRTSKWKLFSDPTAWASEPLLYNGSAGNMRGVQVASDEGFLYLRISGACTECPSKHTYAVALNTVPEATGIKQLPFADATSATTGANFLLYLGDRARARLLIAENYNPYKIVPRPGLPNETELGYKRNFTPAIIDNGNFEEFVVETNRRRFGRDGTLFPGQRYSRSVLRYAASDAEKADTLPEWYSDARSNTIVVRIPWGKLVMTDPSSHRAFFGFGPNGMRTVASIGIDVSVFELNEAGSNGNMRQAKVSARYPESASAKPARYFWKGWEKVSPQPYFKKAYFALQKEFLEQNRDSNQTDGSRASGAGNVHSEHQRTEAQQHAGGARR